MGDEQNEGTWARQAFVPRTEEGGVRKEVSVSAAEPLPDAVARAAQYVLADIQGGEPLPIVLSYVPRAEDGKLGMVVVRIGDDMYGFGVDRTAPSAELMFILAEGIQEHLSETALAWGAARPVCAGHRHPASPHVEGGTAYWACPEEGRRLAEIGQLQRRSGDLPPRR